MINGVFTSEGFMLSEPFKDSKEKVYKAMLESLEWLVHWFHYPQTRDIDKLRGDFRQAEWVVERAHRLESEYARKQRQLLPEHSGSSARAFNVS